MKKITISEWKCLYPIKKIILFSFELFLIYFSVMGIFKMKKFNQVIDFLVWGSFILIAIILFPKVKNYEVFSYQCMPSLSKVFGYKKSAEIIENEHFVEYRGLKETVWSGDLYISEHWIRFQNHYFPKNGIIKLWITCKVTLNRHYYIGFLLITGKVFNKKIAVIPEAATIGDKDYFLKIELLLKQALQENTIAIGIENEEKIELSEDVNLIIEQGTLDSKALQAIIETNLVQKKLVDLILTRNNMDPEFKNRVWIERWKTIPFYKKYLNEKWWKN